MFTIYSRQLNSPQIIFTYFLNVQKTKPIEKRAKAVRLPKRLLSLDTDRSSL